MIIDVVRNMYGCLPCPTCGSKYRSTLYESFVLYIICDDCGRKMAGVRNETEEFEVDEKQNE